MYYIDTCVYMDLWRKDADPKRQDAAKQFIEKCIDDQSTIYYSGFVLKELWYNLEHADFANARALFNTINFEKLIATKQDRTKGMILRWDASPDLSFFDCMHIVLSRNTKSMLVTQDKPLIRHAKWNNCRASKPEGLL
ncbi:MAG: PIN domain-containing protein [DPANN group archaeon]|nr:PIN domain-containing protein [DPANN group archaeon]